MELTLTHDDKTWLKAEAADIAAAGVPQAVVARAIKAAAGEKITAFAERAGARLVAGLTPRRIGEYRIKEEIATDPDAADPASLDLIDRQAASRGMDRAAYLALIATRAAAYRRVTLLIATMEDESWAALDAIPEDDGAEQAVDTLLAGLQVQGEAAITEARSIIEGDA